VGRGGNAAPLFFHAGGRASLDGCAPLRASRYPPSRSSPSESAPRCLPSCPCAGCALVGRLAAADRPARDCRRPGALLVARSERGVRSMRAPPCRRHVPRCSSSMKRRASGRSTPSERRDQAPRALPAPARDSAVRRQPRARARLLLIPGAQLAAGAQRRCSPETLKSFAKRHLTLTLPSGPWHLLRGSSHTSL